MKPLLLIGAVALAAFGIGACGSDDDASSGEPTTNDPGPVHVHGLGVNPRDGALFIATHTGLFRIPEGESEASRVADNFQDTMGFTVVGPDRFLGSGHPDLRQDLPPYLGLIESTNAGEDWSPVSMLGRADFHVLEASGDRTYGFGSDFETRREQLLISRDGGRNWGQLDPPESLLSLAINPSDADEVLASGRRMLYASSDAGRGWRPAPGEPGHLSWPEGGDLYSVDAEGRVATTTDPGSEWTAVGEVGGEPAAFEAAAPEELFVALHDGVIKESDDGGRTWSVRSNP